MKISDFFFEFQRNQGIESMKFYHTKNQGVVILLMYGLLVIPKEIWEKNSTNFAFTTRDKFNIKLPVKTEEINTIKFLRLLRNSLAHANFSIDASNATLTFWNKNSNGNKNFEVEISCSNLGEFIVEVGKYYINDVKNSKNNM